MPRQSQNGLNNVAPLFEWDNHAPFKEEYLILFWEQHISWQGEFPSVTEGKQGESWSRASVPHNTKEQKAASPQDVSQPIKVRYFEIPSINPGQ